MKYILAMGGNKDPNLPAVPQIYNKEVSRGRNLQFTDGGGEMLEEVHDVLLEHLCAGGGDHLIPLQTWPSTSCTFPK